MWQVSGRSDITDFEEVVRLDKEYITNWNIELDEWYFLIPGVFGFLLLIVRPLSFTDTGSIGPLILNYTMVIKYSISPLVSCLGGYHLLNFSVRDEEILLMQQVGYGGEILLICILLE